MDGLDDTTDELLRRGYFEARICHDHPLRAIRRIVDEVIASLAPELSALGSRQRLVQPECILRAMLLQVLYPVPSDRALMGWLEHDTLSRWFVGIDTNELTWNHLAFSIQRGRLVEAGVANRLLAALLADPEVRAILSAGGVSGEIAPPRQWAWPAETEGS